MPSSPGTLSIMARYHALKKCRMTKLGYLQEHLHTVGQCGGLTQLEMVMVLVYIHRCHSLCLEERKVM